MLHRLRRAGLVLLALAGLGPLCGCFGVTQNPSYFPYLLPTGDIIQTHAKPIGPGYYANFDPHAVSVVVRPLTQTNPVRTQYVIIATVLDEKGNPRRNRRVEWMLQGVGNIVEVDESGVFPGRGYKVTPQYAVSYTNWCDHTITRGNNNPNDDFTIRPGQTWCVVTSAVEGDTHVTVYAPGVHNWEKGRVFVTCRWADAAWKFPDPQTAQAGSEVQLTTQLFRSGEQQALAGYKVRYKILDGPQALFLSSRGQEAIATSDISGNATVSLVQNTPQPGVNRVGIEIIRPPDPTTPSGTGVVLASGETTVQWLAPAITLNVTGPQTAGVDQQVSYAITVSNNGQAESRAMTVTSPPADGLQYLSSVPEAIVDGKQLVWTLGRLPPGQRHTLQVNYKTTKIGPATTCAEVVTAEQIRDRKCITTQVGQAGLKVSIAGPDRGLIGQPLTFRVTVANPGPVPATNVQVAAEFDKGLQHDRGTQRVEAPLGRLEPFEQRDLQGLVLTPREAGKLSLRVEAKGDGGLTDRAEQVIVVQQPQLSVKMVGARQRFVGVTAEWEIRVANVGQVPLANVVLRDVLPPEVRFLNSTEGGKPGVNEVTWELGNLQPGDQRAVRVSATCERPAAKAINRATATAEGGVTAGDELPLEIQGVPGLLLRVTDEGDPVPLGKTVKYAIAVTNPGSLPASGIELKATLPPELELVAGGATGPSAALVKGREITFAKVDNVPPQQTLQYVIEARAIKPGDARFRAELRSPILTGGPVIQEESTRVFDPTANGAGPPPPPPALPAPLPPGNP